jgi:hypothetical protein
MPTIRISDDVFRRLQRHATPLVDGINDVLRRILDEFEANKGDRSNISQPKPGGYPMPVSFSPWTAWGGREHLEGTNLPGLYLLGRFDGVPPDQVDPMAAEVIYIGITEKQTLRKRWEQFAASAFSRQLGHSGGWTFNSRYCASEECDPPSWLHVAAMPVGKEGANAIRPLKQQLLAEYGERRGTLPSCNTRSA